MNDELRAFIIDVSANPYHLDDRYFLSRINATCFQLVARSRHLFNHVDLWVFHTDGTTAKHVSQYVAARCVYYGIDGKQIDIVDELVNAGNVIGIYHPQDWPL